MNLLNVCSGDISVRLYIKFIRRVEAMTMLEKIFVLHCYWHTCLYIWTLTINCTLKNVYVHIVSMIAHLIAKYKVILICLRSSKHQSQCQNNGRWFHKNELNYNLLANEVVCDHNKHQWLFKVHYQNQHLLLHCNLTGPYFF